MTKKRRPSRPRAKTAAKPAKPKPAGRAAVDHSDESNEQQVRKLLFDLQVHSEEITVQNEQLLKAQAELEHARDRYADLYDFAPVGYVSLDARAMISDINLAGAELFGRPRSFLIGLPMSSLIAPDDLESLRSYLLACREQRDGAELTVDVSVRRRPQRIVRLVVRPIGIGPGAAQLLTAVLDVTEERRLEGERAELLQREQARAAQLAVEVAERTRAENRIKGLLDRIVSVQEEERGRLARNLHDHLGQQLTALRLTIDTLKATGLTRTDVADKVEIIDRIAAQLDRDVDALVWDLRPAALDDVGLHAALAAFVNDWSAMHGIVADFHGPGAEALRLTADLESHLYRIVQEALNNVIKHAKAQRVSVILERRDNHVTLIVEDDGCGFDQTRVEKDRARGGMGLVGIRERAMLVGGDLVVESAPGKGTTLFVRIPAKTVKLLTP